VKQDKSLTIGDVAEVRQDIAESDLFRHIIGFKVTKGILDTCEVMLKNDRIPVDLVTVAKGTVEDSSFTIVIDPGNGIEAFLAGVTSSLIDNFPGKA
jgi:hypothetical protein